MQEIDNLSKYGNSFQSKVVSALLTDGKFLDKLSEVLSPKFFESEANKWIIDEIQDYNEEFRKPPTMDVFKVKVAKLDNEILKTTVKEQLRHVYTQVGNVDLDYIKKEFTSFCRNQNLKQVILTSVDLLKAGNYNRIKDLVDKAMKVGVETDLGHDYKDDFDSRMDDVKRDTVPTDWKSINDLMDGGLGPGELGVVVAPSGVGKTWILTTLGASAVRQGLSVIHYSLELSEHYVGQRYDSVLTGIPAQNLKNYQEDIEEKMKTISGELVIKYYPTKSTGVMGIKAHIEKSAMLGKTPDLVIVDYADLLKVNNKKDKHEALEELYEDLRGMAGEYEIPVWTASQAGRSSLEDDIIEADKIAASYGKVMVSDFLMSLSRKVEDKLSGTGRGHVIKNRFGPDGITLPSKINTNNGQFQFFEPQTTQGKQTTQIMKTGESMIKKNLAQKFKDLGGSLG